MSSIASPAPHAERGDLDASRQQLNEALNVLSSLEGWELARHSLDVRRCQMLLDLGDVVFALGQVDQAEQIYFSVDEVAQRSNDRKMKVQLLERFGKLWLKHGELDRARQFYELARDIYRKLPDPTGEAASTHMLGIICEAEGHWNRAIQWYLQSLEISMASGLALQALRTMGQLAVVAQRAGNRADAARWHREAMRFSDAGCVFEPDATLRPTKIEDSYDIGLIHYNYLVFLAQVQASRSAVWPTDEAPEVCQTSQ